MQNVIDFLNDLRDNNNRDWFEQNRQRYVSVNEEFAHFTGQLIDGISKFDPAISGLLPKDCLYRIYRDTRFSPNKIPYKTHMAAYICQKGKKSEYAGYYFHVEAEGVNYIGSHLLSAGLYCLQPNIIKSVRDEILDNGAQFVETVQRAKGFSLDQNSRLQRVPKGYPKDSEYAEYLKMKDFSLFKPVDDAFMLSPKLLENTLAEFRKTVEFNVLLNRAVEFALHEM